MDDDAELLLDFRTESLEHLAEIEPLFLELDDAGGEDFGEKVNHIFRAAHSVKGAAGFFGLDLIQDLAHTMENLLMKVRDGELAFRPEMTDALLTALDKLQQLIDALPERIELPIDEEVGLLKPLIAGDAGAPATPQLPSPDAAPEPASAASAPIEPGEDGEQSAPDEPAPRGGATPTFVVEPEVIDDAVRFGHRLHEITVPADIAVDKARLHDVRKQIKAMGNIVREERRGDDDAEELAILAASVIDGDLLATTLGLDVDTVVTFAAKSYPVGRGAPAAAAEAAGPGDEVSEVEAPEGAADEETAQPSKAASPPASGGMAVAARDLVPEPPTRGEDAPGDDLPDIPDRGPKKTSKLSTKKVESAETVRVSVDLLDKLMNLAGELVLGRNQLLARLDGDEDSGIKAVLQNIDLVTSDLQSNIMNTRMQPVGNVFKKYHRVVRDLSRKLGKKVELDLEGTEVELDKSIIEMLSDPLTHLVRNSLDHGLEAPDARKATGKDPVGHVQLRAYHEGGQVNIEIRDDGKGIDPNATRRSAVEKGMMSQEEADALSDSDAVALIFAPGFSMAKEITDVSGRGVGMDVVKSNITKLGGKIDIDSEVGFGTSIRICLPLTLAIIPSLIVGVNDERFAVPQVNLVEIVRVKAEEAAQRLDRVKGADVLRLRGRLLPLVRLADVLEIPRAYPDPESGELRPDRRDNIADARLASHEAADAEVLAHADEALGQRRRNHANAPIHVVVLRTGEDRYGLVVDAIADSEEIVVKPLSLFLKECRCYAGATIMGDGRVATILDVGGVAADAQLNFSEDLEDHGQREATRTSEEEGEARELILFANAREEQFAVSLSQIERLEKIERNDIESIGGSEYIQYLGSGLPLVRLEHQLPVDPIDPESDELYVLIPRVSKDKRAGILASRVIDTVETKVVLDRAAEDAQNIQGRAVVQGRLTTFVDASGLLGEEMAA